MAGLGLKTAEFSKAFQRLYFNTFVQVFNFGVVSAICFGFSRMLWKVGVLSSSLADGMVICSCLSMTVNMVLVLTTSAGGDQASAIFNAAFGNMVGVLLSPVLILGYLRVTGSVDLVDIFYKLALRVLLPIFLGQVLQKTSHLVVEFVKKYKKYFGQAQMYALVFIVYTVFCTTFHEGATSSVGDVFLMILFQFILLTSTMTLAWYLLKLFFREEPKLRVMGLFGCTHKTVAIGVPLINAIYEGNPYIGVYTLPVLIWHSMQLVVGTVLAPRLANWVEAEQQRLERRMENDDHENDDVVVHVEPVHKEEDTAAAGATIEGGDEETPTRPTTNDTVAVNVVRDDEETMGG
jgi:sodium/bile acid cotransporter 7